MSCEKLKRGQKNGMRKKMGACVNEFETQSMKWLLKNKKFNDYDT